MEANIFFRAHRQIFLVLRKSANKIYYAAPLSRAARVNLPSNLICLIREPQLPYIIFPDIAQNIAAEIYPAALVKFNNISAGLVLGIFHKFIRVRVIILKRV